MQNRKAKCIQSLFNYIFAEGGSEIFRGREWIWVIKLTLLYKRKKPKPTSRRQSTCTCTSLLPVEVEMVSPNLGGDKKKGPRLRLSQLTLNPVNLS